MFHLELLLEEGLGLAVRRAPEVRYGASRVFTSVYRSQPVPRLFRPMKIIGYAVAEEKTGKSPKSIIPWTWHVFWRCVRRSSP